MIHPAIGPYAVLSKLGEGGMGAVYRARDTKLNRDVALKVLLPAVANDPDRLARFSREAQVLASLNHPNIAAIFGLEDAGETKALVMELVEGEGLDEKIAAGVGKRESGVGSRTSGVGLPLDEALSIARQIAEALEAAHEQGIVHRDLKPANIKVRPDGTVKVLDFGLAKAMEPGVGNRESGVGETLAHSPTITTPAMTQAGMILGTAAYMSPEQAAGKPVDKRTDLWAFGVVLLEMLTGRRVFDGDTVSHVIAAVLKDEPDWAALPADTPAPIRKLLRRCLQKDRRQRLADAGDARLEIQDALAVPADEGTSAQQASVVSSPRGSRLAWTIAAAAAVLAAGLVVPALRYMRAVPPTPAPETRTDIVTPPAPTPNRSMSFALSPDGRQVVFVAADGDSSRLWLRPLGASGAQPLPGTEGASFPFWAPDSRSVAFFADLKLKRLDLGAGRPEVLAAVAGRGGAWLDGGVILFAGAGGGQIGAGLSRVSATGGEVSVATRLAPRQSTHRFPHALPGGQEFLFYARGSADAGGIYLGSLDAREPTRLTGGDSAGVYLPGQPGPDGSPVGGWLLWVNAGTLRAQSLDLTRRTLVGEPTTLATGVMFDPFTNVSALSVAHTGAIAYRSGQLAAERRQLTWFNRAGTELGTLGEPDQNELGDPTISPDGRRVAVNRQVQNQDIWVIDGARAVRFTFDEAEDRNPVWSPDGRHIVFSSARTGVYDLYSRPADGGGDEQRLVASDQSKRPWHWSPDGRFLLFGSVDAESGGDLWVLPLEGDRTPRVFHKTRFDESFARWSPDGRFVAYQSEESGQTEVYVRPFLDRATEAAGGGQWQVSAGGGIAPVWRPDGKELYYVARGGTLMAVAVRTSGAALEASAPVPLFRVAITARGNPLPGGRQYDVAPDGRFLISISNEDTAAVPITLLQNWSRPTP